MGILSSSGGYLVFLIIFVASLIFELVTEEISGDDQYYQTEAWPLSLALVTAGLMNWLLGRYRHKRGTRTVIDKETGEELTIGDEPRFLFLPTRYWGPILIVLAIVPFILR